MPRQSVLHFNPVGPTFDGKTRCGRKLRAVNWVTDVKDVSCNNCVRLVKRDEVKPSVAEHTSIP